MVNLILRFPGGQYHATPWGNHVNEGLVEWPPSPWRIIRALLATGFSKLGWESVPETGRDLVESLAAALPTYRLPPAIAAHTRHFMPTDSKKPEERTKIFDAFARVERDAELAVSWPVLLSGEATALLSELVAKLSYLGRAESMVEGRLVEDSKLPEGDVASHAEINRPGVEPIALLAPMTSSEYSAWLAQAAPAPTSKDSSKKKAKPGPFPSDSLAALLVDTAFLQKHGWTQPPGTRRVFYYRRPLSTSPVRTIARKHHLSAADTALLTLASDAKNREVLPKMERALAITERLHDALLSKLDGAPCPELSGRDERGERLRGHRHASLIPLDLDADGHLDHLLVHAPDGLGAEAQRALRSVRKLYGGGGNLLFVTLAGLGKRNDFLRVGAKPVDELREATSWVSRTPFVPPRHIKPARHTLEQQIQAELQTRGLPRAVVVELLPREAVVKLGFHHFLRARRDPGRAPAMARFFGLRVDLEGPHRGPISLGYASHFGLGLFTPLD